MREKGVVKQVGGGAGKGARSWTCKGKGRKDPCRSTSVPYSGWIKPSLFKGKSLVVCLGARTRHCISYECCVAA